MEDHHEDRRRLRPQVVVLRLSSPMSPSSSPPASSDPLYGKRLNQEVGRLFTSRSRDVIKERRTLWTSPKIKGITWDCLCLS